MLPLHFCHNGGTLGTDAVMRSMDTVACAQASNRIKPMKSYAKDTQMTKTRMNCQDFREQLFDFMDGTVPAGTRRKIRQHLAACAGCRQMLKEHRQLANFSRLRLAMASFG